MPLIRLLCLPHAGAGPSTFRGWRDLAADNVEVFPVPLPGRERRITEVPYADLHAAIKAVAAETLPAVSDGTPLALFGHCLGALLAYELARYLRQVQQAPVAHLFVSGDAGPARSRRRRATGLPDEAFLSEVAEIAGYQHLAMADPEVRELLLPTLRADVQMYEDYRPADTGPLDVPVTAIRGRDDDRVSAGDMAQWRAATTAGFTTAELPGGHMYFTDHALDLLDLVAGSIGR